VYYKNRTSYSMQYDLSIDRQIGANSLFSMGYIGSVGCHLLTVRSANPGNPALCLSPSQPSNLAPGTQTRGPFEENLVFTRANGTVVDGTRRSFPNQIGRRRNQDTAKTSTSAHVVPWGGTATKYSFSCGTSKPVLPSGPVGIFPMAL
jgi:hypothetical protein